MATEPGLIPTFKVVPVHNEAASRKEGRPIFDEMEICEIRFAGDRNKISVFPAHDVSSDGGTEEPRTYAERFSDQYEQFSKKKQQTVAGTPLDDLPFLGEGKRAELRAMNIYTAEQLADMEGSGLKAMGMGGRSLKNQARAYIDNARNSADPVAQAKEIAELKERLKAAEERADKPALKPVETKDEAEAETANASVKLKDK